MAEDVLRETALEAALEELLFEPAEAASSSSPSTLQSSLSATAAAHLAEKRALSECASTADFVMRHCLFFDDGTVEENDARAFLLNACAIGSQEDDERYNGSNGDTYSESAMGHQLTSVEATRRALCALAMRCHSVTFLQPR
jgi:hypothetical protein